MDLAKKYGHTQVIALLENDPAAIAAQVGASTYRHGSKLEATASVVSQGVGTQYACLSTCSHTASLWL